MSEIDLLVVGAAAMIVTCTAVPFVRQLMLGRGVLDVPNHRSSHSTPVPRGGGIACAAGVAGATLVAAAVGVSVPATAVTASAALALVGLLDDRFNLPAAPRLGAQIAVGALFGAATGGDTLWTGIGAVLVPLVVNVVNFMDGINGITALTLFTWGGTTGLAGLLYGVEALGVLGIATAGAALGFLPFNAPRARIFLGDVGSYLFGALAATGVMIGVRTAVSPALVVAPLVLYAVDVMVTLSRRALRGAPLLEAHREHIYQRLVRDAKLSHLAVSVYIVFVSLSMVLGWTTGVFWIAAVVTTVAISMYVYSPRIISLSLPEGFRMNKANDI